MMDRMKTFLIYILCIAGIWILSEFLINVGLNSKYKDIARIDQNSQVVIYQAQADMVSGKIRGIVTNSEPEEVSGKYICIDFYSPRNVHLGKSYIEIGELDQNASKPFEIFFKLNEVESYEISIVNEKDDNGTLIELIQKELTKPERVIYTLVAMLIFW